MTMDKGHFRAVIDTDDLDDVQVSISMCCSLDTCEALLEADETTLTKELHDLRFMIHDHINHLYQLKNEAMAYAV